MLYILLGEDDFSVSEKLAEIKATIPGELLMANTSLFDGGEVSLEELRTVINSLPFLAEVRLVIVRSLLERFQPKERASRGKNQKDDYKAFAESIRNMSQSTILVLTSGSVKNDNPLFQAIKTGAKIYSFPLKRRRELEAWIGKRVQLAGGSISPEATALLARLVGSELWLMSNEIEKLILFTQGRQIEEEDVTSMVTNAREVSVFNLIDAIFETKCGVAEDLLQHLLESGEAPAYILFMLARQLQLVARAKDMREHRKPRTEIQSRLGLADFAWQKTLEQSDKYRLPYIKEVYKKLLETDLAIKTGKYESETALSILIAELCQKSES